MSESEDRLIYLKACWEKPLNYYLPLNVLEVIDDGGKFSFSATFLTFMLRAKSNEIKLERQTKEWADGKDSLEREVLKLTKDFHTMKKERDKFKRQLARVKGNEGAESDEDGE